MFHPVTNQSFSRNPTDGTTNLVPALLRSTLVCQATPNSPSSCITNSNGFTWIASSKRSDAKIMHKIHHANSREASGLVSSQTNASKRPTISMGNGTASLRVFALLAITDSCKALKRRSSRSGSSIASLAATHLKEVLSAGITDGPHSLWSRVSAYFKILSIWRGCGSSECMDAQISYLSKALTWTAIVLGAPERSTNLFNLARSSSVRSSDWSSNERSLASAPARLPIA